MKLYIYDTEGFEDEPANFTEATGVEHVLLNRKFSKSVKKPHGSPESLLAALDLVEGKEGTNILLIDSLSTVCEFARNEYTLKHPTKDIPYATGLVDARMVPVAAALKQSGFHWIMTMMEKDDKLGNSTIGKKGKASKGLEYTARVKIHCEQQKPPVNTKVTIRDQRGLGDAPATVLKDPKSSDLDFLMERYTTEDARRFRAHCFGRDAGGKTGTAMRLAICLANRLKGGE